MSVCVCVCVCVCVFFFYKLLLHPDVVCKSGSFFRSLDFTKHTNAQFLLL